MRSRNFEILQGLPVFGPTAEAFTATGHGAHREGFAVRFDADDGDSWVGNFQPGVGSLSGVYSHPNGRGLLVVAGGQGYVVDRFDRVKRAYFGGQIEKATVLDQPPLVVFGNGLWFEAIGAGGTEWKTERISWDGMQNIRLEGARITGEAWSPLENRWMAFTVDVQTGKFSGGSYAGWQVAG